MLLLTAFLERSAQIRYANYTAHDEVAIFHSYLEQTERPISPSFYSRRSHGIHTRPSCQEGTRDRACWRTSSRMSGHQSALLGFTLALRSHRRRLDLWRHTQRARLHLADAASLRCRLSLEDSLRYLHK